MQRYDAIIIGAGLNGLTAAARLAAAGLSVLVLERNSVIGGAATGGELAPGFAVPRYSPVTGFIDPILVRELDLPRHGLQLLRLEGGVTLLPDESYIASYRNGAVQRREIERFSRHDADAWVRFSRDMMRAARRLMPHLSVTPPDPVAHSFPGWRAMTALLEKMSAVGAPGVASDWHDDVRLWTMSLVELLDQYFESDALKIHLATPALIGASLGPRSPTTAGLLPLRWLGHTGDPAGSPQKIVPRGGIGAFAAALAAAVRSGGGDIRTDAEVTDIMMRSGGAVGVILADGEEIHGRLTLSDLDLKRSFLSLFQWKDLPKGFVENVGAFHTHGVTAQFNLALDALPSFSAVPAECPALAGGVRVAAPFNQMERAFDDWKERRPPRLPLLDIAIPTLTDPTLAPPGRHVMSVTIQYVPLELHDGSWTPPRRAALSELVLDRLEVHCPDLRSHVIAQDLVTPHEIEGELGFTQGDLAMGDMTLDQMWINRPFAGASGYRTPIRNFFLCSASAHPGTAVWGGAGANAAREALRMLKGGR